MTHSAGIVLYRRTEGGPEILLVHPGGPLWANKDIHGWSIPKGEYDPEAEDGLTAAVREFDEELGQPVPDGERIELGEFRAGKKKIRAWLVEGEVDPEAVESNHFEMEWPPRSGRTASFPEVDRAAWYDLATAERKLHKGQRPICDLVAAALG